MRQLKRLQNWVLKGIDGVKIGNEFKGIIDGVKIGIVVFSMVISY